MNLPPPQDPWGGQQTPPTDKPPSKWKPWHKTTLGIIGLLLFCVCGVAIFAPSPQSGRTNDPAEAPAAQQLAQAPAKTETAPAKTDATPAKTAAAQPETESTQAETGEPTTKAPPPSKTTTKATATKAPSPKPTTKKPSPKPTTKAPAEEEEEDEEQDSGTDPRFRTCGAANDAGYGPYYEGTDPEYDWYQDRDNDGIVCEQ
ncbi:cytoskeletal protein RodZ [Actinoplanes lutulentus]|uniref:excalibur calcium-binding domain-containing protein n=1 Tax=Actinoplanes lutulentus TaxID=1287878 RepID=UPI00185BC9B5|nr:excalibur calcium-binding domain-containing protein [Actinoplanes lutulentus]MBB2940834.1 cytoskeletal protein RodZ [Actinoplanes lutulentus]